MLDVIHSFVCTVFIWHFCDSSLLFLLGDCVIITMFSNFSICGSVCVWYHSLQILKLHANLKPTRVAMRFKIQNISYLILITDSNATDKIQ
jgi:hypothetical protein